MRNHGQSPHSHVHTYHSLAHDLKHYLESHNIRKPTLIGHSMGGKTAMYLSLLHPSLVDRLVVIDIAPVSYAHNHDDRFEAMKAVPLDKITSKQDASKYIAKYFPSKPGDTKKFKWMINLHVLHEQQYEITDFPHITEGAKFTRPSLFIGGTESHRLHADYHPAVYRFFPKAQINMQKGGHFVYPWGSVTLTLEDTQKIL